MVFAELRKIWHNATFRIFFCIFLIAGIIHPLIAIYSPDNQGILRSQYERAYQSYNNQNAVSVTKEIEQQIQFLNICQELEVLDNLPAEIAEIHLESLVNRYELSEEEMEDLNASLLLRFSDNLSDEIIILEAVKEQADRAEGYAGYLQSIQKQKDTIHNSIMYQNNDYAQILAHNTAEEYSKLQGVELPMTNPCSVQTALGTWVDDVIGCGIVCIAALFLFLQERQEGMTILLFSTKYGRRSTYFSKMILIVFLGSVSCILFVCIRLLIAGDFGDLSRPVQTVPAFYTSPHKISVLSLLIGSTVQRILATVFVGFLMGLLCILLDRSLALSATAVFAAVNVLNWQGIDASSWLQWMKYLSVPALFSDETLLGNLVYVKLFGIPVNFLHTSISLLIAGSLTVLYVGNYLYTHSHRALSIPSRSTSARQKKRIPTLFSQELKMIMLHQKAAILFLAVLVIQPYFYNGFRTGITSEELRYQEKVVSIEGAFSQEIHNELLAERENLQVAALTAGSLMANELSERIATLDRVIVLSDYLSRRTETVHYVYETGYKAIFGRHPVGARYQPILLAVVLTVMLPSLFTLETESGMDRLAKTTKEIKRARLNRWKIALLLTTAVFLVIWMPELIFIVKYFPVHELNASAVSVQMLSYLPDWIPLWGAIVSLYLLRFATSLISCLLIGLVGIKTGKYLTTVLISILFHIGTSVVIR